MPAIKYKVELNERERTHLKEIARRGERSARKVKRGLVLLGADEGLSDQDIASGLFIGTSTVGRVRAAHAGRTRGARGHAVCTGGTGRRTQ